MSLLVGAGLMLCVAAKITYDVRRMPADAPARRDGPVFIAFSVGTAGLFVALWWGGV